MFAKWKAIVSTHRRECPSSTTLCTCRISQGRLEPCGSWILHFCHDMEPSFLVVVVFFFFLLLDVFGTVESCQGKWMWNLHFQLCTCLPLKQYWVQDDQQFEMKIVAIFMPFSSIVLECRGCIIHYQLNILFHPKWSYPPPTNNHNVNFWP